VDEQHINDNTAKNIHEFFIDLGNEKGPIDPVFFLKMITK
jgi:hypothetical protein